ncbi:MAG TPA: T9SS type A sorting domain-containing protein, partial [Ignavibacteriaceae bacterium]|nr:T9SS type A sorting domain-containing protein [Ignavibacteriaceae bacterium]
YSSFINEGRIPQTFDSVVAIYGYNFVIQQGILPWAIMTTIDTLQKTFERRDWNKAILTAADLGHYIADGHNPLHITRNYNGQYTNQNGVHSRYESNMINRFQLQINYSGDSASFVDDINNYVFSFLYSNYDYVDSVLYADSAAKAFAGNTTSDLYYNKMWEISKGFTIMLFKNASKFLAELIYTAWVNAGSPSMITEAENEENELFTFNLEQNFPNPFNPSTTIRYYLPYKSKTTLKIYNIVGKEVVVLVDEIKDSGLYEVEFKNDIKLSSGVYFYTLKTEDFTETKKFVLLK